MTTFVPCKKSLIVQLVQICYLLTLKGRLIIIITFSFETRHSSLAPGAFVICPGNIFPCITKILGTAQLQLFAKLSPNPSLAGLR